MERLQAVQDKVSVPSRGHVWLLALHRAHPPLCHAALPPRPHNSGAWSAAVNTPRWESLLMGKCGCLQGDSGLNKRKSGDGSLVQVNTPSEPVSSG